MLDASLQYSGDRERFPRAEERIKNNIEFWRMIAACFDRQEQSHFDSPVRPFSADASRWLRHRRWE